MTKNSIKKFLSLLGTTTLVASPIIAMGGGLLSNNPINTNKKVEVDSTSAQADYVLNSWEYIDMTSTGQWSSFTNDLGQSFQDTINKYGEGGSETSKFLDVAHIKGILRTTNNVADGDDICFYASIDEAQKLITLYGNYASKMEFKNESYSNPSTTRINIDDTLLFTSYKYTSKSVYDISFDNISYNGDNSYKLTMGDWKFNTQENNYLYSILAQPLVNRADATLTNNTRGYFDYDDTQKVLQERENGVLKDCLTLKFNPIKMSKFSYNSNKITEDFINRFSFANTNIDTIDFSGLNNFPFADGKLHLGQYYIGEGKPNADLFGYYYVEGVSQYFSFKEATINNIIWSDNIDQFGKNLFFATNINEVTLPQNLEFIGRSCFKSSKIKTFNSIPSLLGLDSLIFNNCEQLISVNFDSLDNDKVRNNKDNPLSIGFYRMGSAFIGCIKLEYLDLRPFIYYDENLDNFVKFINESIGGGMISLKELIVPINNYLGESTDTFEIGQSFVRTNSSDYSLENLIFYGDSTSVNIRIGYLSKPSPDDFSIDDFGNYYLDNEAVPPSWVGEGVERVKTKIWFQTEELTTMYQEKINNDTDGWGGLKDNQWFTLDSKPVDINPKSINVIDKSTNNVVANPYSTKLESGSINLEAQIINQSDSTVGMQQDGILSLKDNDSKIKLENNILSWEGLTNGNQYQFTIVATSKMYPDANIEIPFTLVISDPIDPGQDTTPASINIIDTATNKKVANPYRTKDLGGSINLKAQVLNASGQTDGVDQSVTWTLVGSEYGPSISLNEDGVLSWSGLILENDYSFTIVATSKSLDTVKNELSFTLKVTEKVEDNLWSKLMWLWILIIILALTIIIASTIIIVHNKRKHRKYKDVDVDKLMKGINK